MRMTKPGNSRNILFKGRCRSCGAEFEASPAELEGRINVNPDPREGSHRYAVANCTDCGAVGQVHLWEHRI